ncbi:DNA-directed RNA polymerase I subunit RPA49 [Lepisosteus oculatus]|uniref:DNA-directed RNA polymerase I subunit RPA49 n=1 Tax=Lepisosteus oculatus TaxID=7918 RepID=UPI0035F503A4
MAASYVWKHCNEEREEREERPPAAIVQFSNGKLRNADLVDFTLYRNTDLSNPRKKNRRILAAETDRLCYVGNNYGAEALKCNTLCKYYVGVLDKKTRTMNVHNVELFSMQPVIPGETVTEVDALEHKNKSYREKVDSLIEAFGTNKQKRALSSRRLNQVGSEMLHSAVAKAAENVIQKKGLQALERDVAQTEAQQEMSLLPCHADADKLEDVYLFDDIISPAEYEALEVPAQALKELSSEDVLKMREDGSPQVLIQEMQCLPKDEESREHMARCLWYLKQLIKLSSQRRINLKFSLEEGCPRIVVNRFLKTFTMETFSDGRINNTIPSSMKTKIAAYALALLLHIGDFQVDLTLLHRDLQLTENKMLDVARSMRLKIVKKSVLASGDVMEDHKIGVLELPLIMYNQRVERKKRKKMT